MGMREQYEITCDEHLTELFERELVEQLQKQGFSQRSHVVRDVEVYEFERGDTIVSISLEDQPGNRRRLQVSAPGYDLTDVMVGSVVSFLERAGGVLIRGFRDEEISARFQKLTQDFRAMFER